MVINAIGDHVTAASGPPATGVYLRAVTVLGGAWQDP
jgi:hypothetical protein